MIRYVFILIAAVLLATHALSDSFAEEPAPDVATPCEQCEQQAVSTDTPPVVEEQPAPPDDPPVCVQCDQPPVSSEAPPVIEEQQPPQGSDIPVQEPSEPPMGDAPIQEQSS